MAGGGSRRVNRSRLPASKALHRIRPSLGRYFSQNGIALEIRALVAGFGFTKQQQGFRKSTGIEIEVSFVSSACAGSWFTVMQKYLFNRSGIDLA